jgi:hypothetical protein
MADNMTVAAITAQVRKNLSIGHLIVRQAQLNAGGLQPVPANSISDIAPHWGTFAKSAGKILIVVVLWA